MMPTGLTADPSHGVRPRFLRDIGCGNGFMHKDTGKKKKLE